MLPLFRRVQRGQAVIMISAVTEAELLVKAEMLQKPEAFLAIEDLLSEDGIYVVNLDRRLARASARIRARGLANRKQGERKMELPDAIIVATAIETGCDAIVGNDAAWRGRTEIPFVYLEDAVTNH